MATVVRPKLSEKNKYYIDKHRYYELKHFCLQYNEWKKLYTSCCEALIFTSKFETFQASTMPSDLTAKYALKRAQYAERIKMVEDAARESDEFLYPYILNKLFFILSYFPVFFNSYIKILPPKFTETFSTGRKTALAIVF